MLTTDISSPSSKAVSEKDCSTSENVTQIDDNVPASTILTTEPTRATTDSESTVTKLNDQKRSPSICGDINLDTSSSSHDLDQEYVDDNEEDEDDQDVDHVDLCDCSSDSSEECCVGCTTTPTTLTHLSDYDDEDDEDDADGDEAETEEAEEKLDDGNASEPIETNGSETDDSDDTEDDSTDSCTPGLVDSQEDEDDDDDGCGVSSTEVSVNDSRITMQKDQKHGFNNNGNAGPGQSGHVNGGGGRGRFGKQTGNNSNNGNNQFKLNSRPFRPGNAGFNRQRFMPNAMAQQQQQPQFNNHNHLQQQQQPQQQPMVPNTSHQRYMKLGNMMRVNGGGVSGTNNNNNNNNGGNNDGNQHYISNWGHRSNLVDKNGHIQRVTMELTNYIAIYKARYFYYFDLVNGRYPQFVRQFDNGMEIWRMSFNVYASGFMNLIAHLGEIHAFYQMEWVGQQLKWVYKDFNFYPNKMRYGFRVNSYDIADIYSRFIKFVCVKDNLLKSFPNVSINHKYYIKHKFEENLQAMKNRLNEVGAQIMVGSNNSGNANDGQNSLPDSEDVQCGTDHLVIDPDQIIGSTQQCINNQTQKPSTTSREQQQQQQGKNFIGPSFNRIQQQPHRRFRNKGGNSTLSSSLTSSNKNGNNNNNTNPDVVIRRGAGGNLPKQQQQPQRGTSSVIGNNGSMVGGRVATKY